MSAAASISISVLPERTKSRLLELVKRHGTMTAQEIAQKLEISVPAARRHLCDLQDQGLIESRTERPAGRGRPQHVFVLSDLGETAFPKTYSSLCVDVLRQVEAVFGSGAVMKIFEGRNVDLAQHLHAKLPKHVPLEMRLEILTSHLSQLGFDAVIEADGEHLYLVQRNCPNLTVAKQFKELCHAELELYSSILEQPIQREKTIACGQGVCRYRIS